MKPCNSFEELKIGSIYSGHIEFIAKSGSGSHGYNFENALYIGKNIDIFHTFKFFTNEKIVKINYWPIASECTIKLFEIKDIDE